jgi:hypothetical protein
MNPPNPDDVLRQLEITYAMLEAVEDYCSRDLIEAKTAVSMTIMQWGGIQVDFERVLELEIGKRHNRIEGASHDRSLRLVPDPEPWKIIPPGTRLP